jgi:hypothetical protein
MPWFTTPRRQGRPGPALRARLAVEQLDARVTPGSLDPSPPEGDSYLVAPDSTPPVIVDFTGGEVLHGWYSFTGRVDAGESSGGLTVTFGGVPSLQGRTAVTASDGTFSLLVQVKTDGSDDGTVTAQTVANGQQSNQATWDITPTP